MRQLRFWYGSQPLTIRLMAGEGVSISTAESVSRQNCAHLVERGVDGRGRQNSGRSAGVRRASSVRLADEHPASADSPAGRVECRLQRRAGIEPAADAARRLPVARANGQRRGEIAMPAEELRAVAR